MYILVTNYYPQKNSAISEAQMFLENA